MSPSTLPRRAPFAPIPWLTDHAILGVALAFESIVDIVRELEGLPQLESLFAIAVEVPAIALAVWLSRAKDPAQAARGAGLWFLADAAALAIVARSALPGLATGMPLAGQLLLAGMSWVMRSTLLRWSLRTRGARALDSQDRLLLFAAGWTAALSVLACFPAVLALGVRPALAGDALDSVRANLTGPSMIAAAVVATFALYRLRARKRWLARVLRGDDVRWRVLPLTESAAPAPGTLPLVRIDMKPDAAIVPREDAESAYRSAESRAPVALVRR